MTSVILESELDQFVESARGFLKRVDEGFKTHALLQADFNKKNEELIKNCQVHQFEVQEFKKYKADEEHRLNLQSEKVKANETKVEEDAQEFLRQKLEFKQEAVQLLQKLQGFGKQENELKQREDQQCRKEVELSRKEKELSLKEETLTRKEKDFHHAVELHNRNKEQDRLVMQKFLTEKEEFERKQTELRKTITLWLGSN